MPFTFVDSPAFGLSGACKACLEHPFGLPDEETYGVRLASSYLAPESYTRFGKCKYSISKGNWVPFSSLHVFEREDGRPMQVFSIVDMSRCKGGAGVFALAEYLPLMHWISAAATRRRPSSSTSS